MADTEEGRIPRSGQKQAAGETLPRSFDQCAVSNAVLP